MVNNSFYAAIQHSPIILYGPRVFWYFTKSSSTSRAMSRIRCCPRKCIDEQRSRQTWIST